jgi:(p)ppGpp synthase/HD superfamily hydrolase
VVIKNEPGALAGIANVIARDGANIVSLDQTARDGSFHTFVLGVEVHDVEHLMRLIAALRATDMVSSAQRV